MQTQPERNDPIYLNKALLLDILNLYRAGIYINGEKTDVLDLADNVNPSFNLSNYNLQIRINQNPDLSNISLAQYRQAVKMTSAILTELPKEYYSNNFALVEKSWITNFVLKGNINIYELNDICVRIRRENEIINNPGYHSDQAHDIVTSSTGNKLFVPKFLTQIDVIINEFIPSRQKTDIGDTASEGEDEENSYVPKIKIPERRIPSVFANTTDRYTQSDGMLEAPAVVSNATSTQLTSTQLDEIPEAQSQIRLTPRVSHRERGDDNEDVEIMADGVDDTDRLEFDLGVMGLLTQKKIDQIEIDFKDYEKDLRFIKRLPITKYHPRSLMDIKKLYSQTMQNMIPRSTPEPINFMALSHLLLEIKKRNPNFNLHNLQKDARKDLVRLTLARLEEGNPVEREDAKIRLGQTYNNTALCVYNCIEPPTIDIWKGLGPIFRSTFKNSKLSSTHQSSIKMAEQLEITIRANIYAFENNAYIEKNHESINNQSKFTEFHFFELIKSAMEADQINSELRRPSQNFQMRIRELLEDIRICEIVATKIENGTPLHASEQEYQAIHDRIRKNCTDIKNVMEECLVLPQMIIKRQVSKKSKKIFIGIVIVGILGTLAAVITRAVSVFHTANQVYDHFDAQQKSDTNNLTEDIANHQAVVTQVDQHQHQFNNVVENTNTVTSTYVPGIVDTSLANQVGGAIPVGVPQSNQDIFFNGTKIDINHLTPAQLNVLYDQIHNSANPGLVDQSGNPITKATFDTAIKDPSSVFHFTALGLQNSDTIMSTIETNQSNANADVYAYNASGNLVPIASAGLSIEDLAEIQNQLGSNNGNSALLHHKDGTIITKAELATHSYDILKADITRDDNTYMVAVNTHVQALTNDINSHGGHIDSAALTSYFDANPQQIAHVTASFDIMNTNMNNLHTDQQAFQTWSAQALANPGHTPPLPHFNIPAIAHIAQQAQNGFNTNPHNGYIAQTAALVQISQYQDTIIQNGITDAGLPANTITIPTTELLAYSITPAVDTQLHKVSAFNEEAAMVVPLGLAATVIGAGLGAVVADTINKDKINNRIERRSGDLGQRNMETIQNNPFIVPHSNYRRVVNGVDLRRSPDPYLRRSSLGKTDNRHFSGKERARGGLHRTKSLTEVSKTYPNIPRTERF